MNIYCGNNQLDPDLLNGSLNMGNRYQCLKKGIGKGLNLPYDEKYSNDYIPIDDRKIYCGNNDVLPEGYHSYGNLPQCLQKGIGIGKRQRAINGPSNNFSPLTYILRYKKYILILLIAKILFIILYFGKPNIIMTKDQTEKYKINWGKFVIVYLIVYLPILLLIFITV